MAIKFGQSQHWKRFFSSFKENILCAIFISAVLFLSASIISCLQVIFYLTIRPWSHRVYRKVDSYLVTNIAYTLPVFVLQWWSNYKLELFADPSTFENRLGKEHAILLLNHKYEIDWLFPFAIANHFGILGNMRIFSKKSIQYIPILGWTWKLHENILLERNWEKDKTHLSRQLSDLLIHSDPGIMALFSEGTRFTPKKHQESMAVAREKGLPELKHHLLPRTRGFVEIVKVLKMSNVPAVAVYDTLVAVVNSAEEETASKPTFMNLMKGRGSHVKILLRRYSVDEIPLEEEECANWLHEKFQEKDKIMDCVMRTGNFVDGKEKEGENYKRYRSLELPSDPYILVNFLFFSVLLLAPLLGFIWTSVLISGMMHWTSIIILLLVVIGYLTVNALDNVNKIEKSSSYGLVK